MSRSVFGKVGFGGVRVERRTKRCLWVCMCVFGGGGGQEKRSEEETRVKGMKGE